MIDSIIARIRNRFPARKAADPQATREAALKDSLSQEELAALRGGLAMMSPAALRDFYRNAHRRCALEGDAVPKPSDIHGLVQAWRQMREKQAGLKGAPASTS